MTSPENATHIDDQHNEGAHPMSDHHETIDPQRLETARHQVPALWGEVQAQPEAFIASNQRLAYVAGGGAVLRFGVDGPADSAWNKMMSSAVDQQITIAGVSFSLEELKTMGDFYRWLKQEKGKNLHCIDERLDEDPAYEKHEIHCGCGACAAIRAAVGDPDTVDYEVKLAQELGQLENGQAKRQPILKEMESAHASISILVDYSGEGRTVSAGKRSELQTQDALPFNVSLPLEYIREFAQAKGVEAESLISTLARWNVQIARNIIGGAHNVLHDLQAETRLIIDSRGVDDQELAGVAQTYLQPIVAEEKQVLLAA